MPFLKLCDVTPSAAERYVTYERTLLEIESILSHHGWSGADRLVAIRGLVSEALGPGEGDRWLAVDTLAAVRTEDILEALEAS